MTTTKNTQPHLCQECQDYCPLLGRHVTEHHRKLCRTGSTTLRNAMAAGSNGVLVGATSVSNPAAEGDSATGRLLDDECSRFVGRLREICEGTADLSLDKINAYRAMWGLSPLAISARSMRHGSRTRRSSVSRRNRQGNGCSGCNGKGSISAGSLTGSGPGSRLLQMYSQAGMPHCDACYELAVQMDGWGKEGCRQRLNKIVDDIFPRAKAWMAENMLWMHRLMPGIIEDAGIRLKIRQDVQKAIDASTNGFVPKPQRTWVSAFRPAAVTPRYISVHQFQKDIQLLVSKLPPDITEVAGVARSGLYPATMIAMMLHLPLTIIRHHQGDWIQGGNGWRLNEGRPGGPRKVLIVDDTTMTGNSLKRTRHVIAGMPGQKLFAAVYVNPAAKEKPDLWAVDLPWPHLLEWNLFNSVLNRSCAFDLDGILCHDAQTGAMPGSPLYLARKNPIPLIVTGRPAKHRPQTEAWLRNWNLRWQQLVMAPWEDVHRISTEEIAGFKAVHYREFRRRRVSIKPHMFIESCPRQAKLISELTDGGLVVCPTSAECFGRP